MENPRKGRARVSRASPEVTPDSKVTFDWFFVRSVMNGKLKMWHKREIAAFFKDMKLNDKENLEVFESALKKY